MKLFHFIFSVYILWLCSVPCNDICDDMDSTVKSEISNQPVNQAQDETCSPFCNCFCCGSIAIVVSVLPKMVSVEFNSNKVFHPEVPKIKNVSFSIWQPPKTV